MHSLLRTSRERCALLALPSLMEVCSSFFGSYLCEILWNKQLTIGRRVAIRTGGNRLGYRLLRAALAVGVDLVALDCVRHNQTNVGCDASRLAVEVGRRDEVIELARPGVSRLVEASTLKSVVSTRNENIGKEGLDKGEDVVSCKPVSKAVSFSSSRSVVARCDGEGEKKREAAMY